MASVLIVDDEEYAVEALMERLDWESLGVDRLHAAFDVDEAKAVIGTSSVDVIICDIEMPGESGFSLIEWVNEHHPDIVTVFLTGHAEFDYARQAVALQTLDYLMKPVTMDTLRQTVIKALEKSKLEKENGKWSEMYRKYALVRESQRLLLVERFWQDMLEERVMPSAGRLLELLGTAEIPLKPDGFVVPILISVETWTRELNSRDEEILEYALRNAAEEMLLGEDGGDVIRDRDGINMALLYAADERGTPRETLRKRCEAFIAAANRYFYAHISCYVGEATPLDAISTAYHRLIEKEQDNLGGFGSVVFSEESRGEALKPVPLPIEWDQWILLLDLGKRDEFMRRLEDISGKETGQRGARETLNALYYSLIHLFYYAAHKHGFSIKEIMGSKRELEDPSATRSFSQWKSWAARMAANWFSYLEKNEGKNSAIIEKVKLYIHSDLKSANRESAAEKVYVNPSYLSRLFKKETGQSILDYMMQAKMNRAKLLLTETDMKIGDICDFLGYDNLSHFGKMFKRSIGVTPIEYRKRYHDLN